jgi:septal ring factor EnvC (AmiA/AmiB activator)
MPPYMLRVSSPEGLRNIDNTDFRSQLQVPDARPRASADKGIRMNRNTTMIAVLVVLMLAAGVPAYGASKEMIELQEQIKLLGDRMGKMQQSFDEKLAAIQVEAEQTANNVKQISTWAAHVDATLKQQTADSDTCADQISGSSKALRDQLEELHAKLDGIAKELHDIKAAPATSSPAAPPAAGADSSTGSAPRPPDTPQH